MRSRCKLLAHKKIYLPSQQSTVNRQQSTVNRQQKLLRKL